MFLKKNLGSTDLAVSAIGLGTVKLGRNQGVKYPTEFELPTDKAFQNLLAYSKDIGINLLDTAPAYGISEERLGKFLKNTRKDWVICTKAGEDFAEGNSTFDFSPAAIRASVERSLKRLHTDYLDIVLIHSNGEDVKIINEFGAFNTLHALKKAGMIRAFGMSTKTVEGGLLAVAESDIVMVTFNPIESEDRAVIQQAQLIKKGIFIKKALASGHINKIAEQDPVRVAMDFIFSEAGVNSVILGTLNKEHLTYNAECVADILLES